MFYSGGLRSVVCVVFLGISGLFSYLSAELLIINVLPNGTIAPLDVATISADHKDRLYGIMMQYQWPSNTAYALSGQISQQVKNALFAPKSAAEEDVIRSLIKKAFGDVYDVVFVPTTLYELYTLSYFFEGSSPRFVENIGKIVQGFDEYQIKNEAEKNGSSLANVLSIFKKAFENGNKGTDSFSTFKKHFAPCYAPHAQEAYFEINEHLGRYLLDNKSFSSTADCIAYIKRDCLELGGRLIDKLSSAYRAHHYYSYSYANSLDPFDFTSVSKHELNGDKKIKSDGIIARTLALEYEARDRNQGIFFRGTNVISHLFNLSDPTIGKVIDSTLCGGDFQSITIFVDAYNSGSLKPRSISYGNSLFAAGVCDPGAMAYNYFRHYENMGYALLIDKDRYVSNQCYNLCFVSPLPPLVALFVRGAWFHSRVKGAVSSLPGIGYNVDGIYGGSFFKDMTNFLIVQRNPLLHEAIFSVYLADHACLIKPIACVDFALFNHLKSVHHHVADVINQSPQQLFKGIGAIPTA